VEQDIVKNQLAANERLTPAGWRAQEAGALGTFAPDVPLHFPAEHRVGDRLPDYAQGAKPVFSLWRNIRGQVMTVGMLTGVIRRCHVYEEGTWNTVKSWLTSLRKGKHAPISEKYLSAVDIILPLWAMRMSEHYGVTLSFQGMDKLKALPKGAPVVFGAFPHSAIYTDFLFWYALPRARFVADEYNFHDARIIRTIGLAWFLDVIGSLYAKRKKSIKDSVNTKAGTPPSAENGNEKSSARYQQTAARMAKHGLLPIYFGQQGRVPPAYRDDGSLDRPGLYSSVVSLENPERYYNLRGTLNTALAAAKHGGRDAFIPILHIEGSGLVMPKTSKIPPYIQPVQPGEVTFSIKDIIRVTPTSTIDAIEKEIIEAAKRAMRIDEFLRGEVTRWAEDRGKSSSGEAFAHVADANEIYYIIADRIRSVHPNLSQREEFKSRLLNLAAREVNGEAVAEDLQNLLRDVSLVVKETEYRSH
jgi:hypothetical protein